MGVEEEMKEMEGKREEMVLDVVLVSIAEGLLCDDGNGRGRSGANATTIAEQNRSRRSTSSCLLKRGWNLGWYSDPGLDPERRMGPKFDILGSMYSDLNRFDL